MADGVDIRVMRGTKGRIVGWLAFCDEHGVIDEPQPVLRKAQRIAIDHGNGPDHGGNARIRTQSQ